MTAVTPCHRRAWEVVKRHRRHPDWLEYDPVGDNMKIGNETLLRE